MPEKSREGLATGSGIVQDPRSAMSNSATDNVRRIAEEAGLSLEFPEQVREEAERWVRQAWQTWRIPLGFAMSAMKPLNIG